jgi:isopenicillin N synthase-like dioxygenase
MRKTGCKLDHPQLLASASSHMDIPLIDLSDALASGGARSVQVAQQLRAAAMATGFFYIQHHGVSADLERQQFELTRELLGLPLATRQALSARNSKTMRGFTALGAQTLDESAQPDLNECFYCGMAYPPDHPYVLAGYQTYGGNQWPSALPHAGAQCETYIQALLALSRRLMQLLALSLALPEAYFDATSQSPMVTLRMLRYPPHPPNADARTFGAGAHTDWGALTLLAQDAHGGLEVALPDGSWQATPPLPGTFIVNLGDMMPRWTNGLYRSSLHRVRNTLSGGAARYSIPFFYEPDYMARIEAVPGTLAAGDEPLFEPCTAGEHLKQMYQKTYG